MSHHENTISHTNRQGTTRTTLTGDNCHHRHRHPRKLQQIDGNRFRLIMLLRCHTGISARGIDQRNDGQVEFFSMPEATQSLSIALRLRHAEITLLFVTQRASLLRSCGNDSVRTQLEETQYHRLIVNTLAITMQLHPCGVPSVEVVTHVRSLRMPGNGKMV